MTKALVTGGTGFIGSALVRGLLNSGYDVRVFDNNFRGASTNLESVADAVELVEGDIRNAEDVRRAVHGVDHVYHLAFINGTENFYNRPGLVMEVGIKGHFNIMDAMAESERVELFVNASSAEIYQDAPVIPTPENVPGVVPDVHNPRYSYGGAKLFGELLTLHYSPDKEMKRIIFRPHNIYGPAMGFEHVIPQLVGKVMQATNGLSEEHAKVEIQGTGEETRAFCFVEDAVRGIITAGEKGEHGQVYHVGTSEEVTIKEVLEGIGTTLGVTLSAKPGELTKGSTPRRCPDISKVNKLGYKPEYDLAAGLSKTVPWYRDHYMANAEEGAS